jgi:hypothetical protein
VKLEVEHLVRTRHFIDISCAPVNSQLLQLMPRRDNASRVATSCLSNTSLAENHVDAHLCFTNSVLLTLSIAFCQKPTRWCASVSVSYFSTMASKSSVSIDDGAVVQLAVQHPSVGEGLTLALTHCQPDLIVPGPASNLK